MLNVTDKLKQGDIPSILFFISLINDLPLALVTIANIKKPRLHTTDFNSLFFADGLAIFFLCHNKDCNKKLIF